MELKKGMYVRNDFEGIGKVEDICTCEQCKERGFYEPIISYANHTEYVSSYNNMQLYEGRASNNIIDLIEEGDYVNGEYVWKDDNGTFFEKETMWVGDLEQGNYLSETKIETIVTKEQFESMEYKVNE